MKYIPAILNVFVLIMTVAAFDPGIAYAQECYPDLAGPELEVTGTEHYETGGQQWTLYLLAVTNSSDFPDEFFEPAPDLPPCGLNDNASRTWVNIFDNNDTYLYGFCGISSIEELNQIWFAVPRGQPPPESVYITLADRRCQNTYTSNLASTNLSAVTLTVNSIDDVYDGICDAVHCSLRDAAAEAQSGNTIVFDPGLAGQTIVLARGTLSLGKELTINGLGAENLTIDGNGAGSVFAIEPGAVVAIAGMTITGGDSELGGGLHNAGTLFLTNSAVSGNTAIYDGGGLYVDGGEATLTNSTISGNTATYDGGGLYIDEGIATLTDSSVSGNTATYGGGGLYNYFTATLTLTNTTVGDNGSEDGGGLFNFGTANLANSTVSGNAASENGGGLYSVGTVTLTNTTVSGNTASSEYGGGLFSNGTATLTNSTVSSNTAGNGGGGLYTLGTVILANTTVSGNTASDDGGGLYSRGSSATLTNSTVSGNIAGGDGGGLYNFGSRATLTLTNSTVGGNSAASNGGGLYNVPGATLEMTHTIIAGNTTTRGMRIAMAA